MEDVNFTPAYGDVLYMMLGAFVIFLALFLVYLWRSGWGRKEPGKNVPLRQIKGYEAVREGLSRAAETGRALHTSPGTGGVGTGGTTTASTLAGLNLAESMARVSAITGAPVVATTNDAVAYALTENSLRRGYARAGWALESESASARFITQNDPLAYMAGATEVVTQQQTSQAVMAGQFGPEVLFLMEAQRRIGADQIAGSTDVQGISIMFLTTRHTLIGEEIFASGAYLEARKSHIASLLAQDGLRWIIILAIVVGFIIANAAGVNPLSWFTFYP